MVVAQLIVMAMGVVEVFFELPGHILGDDWSARFEARMARCIMVEACAFHACVAPANDVKSGGTGDRN